MCSDGFIGRKKKVVGLNQVRRVIRRGKARLVFVARDVDSSIFDEIVSLAEEAGVELRFVDSKIELGRRAGVNRPASSVALLK